jgi:hypothetical protein
MEPVSGWTKIRTITGILGMLKGSWGWIRDRWSRRMPGIVTTRFARDESNTGAIFKMKVYVNIENRTGSQVRLSHCFFTFHRPARVRPDPGYSGQFDTAKGAYRCDFRNPDPVKNVHDQGEVTLSNGAKTSIWIGVDPNHSEADVKEALRAGNIGKLEFAITKQNGWKAKSSRFVTAV